MVPPAPGVLVAVGVGVGVKVGVRVGVLVGVLVGVEVAVAPPAVTITSCGLLATVVASRLDKLVPVVLVVASTILYCPAPVTSAVTSTDVHVLATIAPDVPKLLPKVGALL